MVKQNAGKRGMQGPVAIEKNAAFKENTWLVKRQRSSSTGCAIAWGLRLRLQDKRKGK